MSCKEKSIQFPKHEKSEFPWYGESMEKHKHLKLCVSLIFHVKQKSMQFPKHGENEFP